MMKRVEHHRLKPSSPFYAMLREFCHRSKNLYNHGNFLIRQTFIDDGKWLRYGEVDRLLKADTEYPDYREMPTAQTAQQTLRILDKNWTSFFAAIKDWKAHPEKYKGRPKLPKYKPKDGYFPLVLTNQNCKLKDGVIRFPRVFQGFTVKAIFSSQPDAVFKQARIIPHGGEIDLELVYEIPEVEEKENNGRYAAIDIGVDNLAALAWNTGERPVLLKGTPLKSVNQYYNKQMAKRRSICERMNGRHSSAHSEAEPQGRGLPAQSESQGHRLVRGAGRVGTGHRQEQGLETGSEPRPQAQPELCAATFRPLHPDAPVQG